MKVICPNLSCTSECSHKNIHEENHFCIGGTKCPPRCEKHISEIRKEKLKNIKNEIYS